MSGFSGVSMFSAFTGGIFGGLVAPEAPRAEDVIERADARTTAKVVACAETIGLGTGGVATVEMCRRSREDREALRRHDRETKQEYRENKSIVKRESKAADSTVHPGLRDLHHGRARAAEDRNREIERERQAIKEGFYVPRGLY